MLKVYYESYGGLYLVGKVRKHYAVGDTLKLKYTICKLRVIETKNNEIIVKPA